MADYKRLVSYIYNYELGIRKKNVGFSRVESKNGQCKVTIHITTGTSSHEPLKVYLFHRDNRKMEGIFFGEMNVKNGTGDFRAETSTYALMNSEYSLDDISGVLILLNENKFFGSQWDDQEIHIQNFEEYDKDKKAKAKEDKLVKDIVVEPADVSDMEMQEKLADQIKAPSYGTELQAAEMSEEAKVKEAAAVDEVVGETENKIQKFFGEEDAEISPQAQALEQEEIQENIQEKTQESYVAQEVGDDKAEMEVGEEKPKEEVLMSDTEPKETHMEEEVNKAGGQTEQAGDPLEAASMYKNCCNSDNYPECVRNVLRNFPSVKPFPESNPEMWVRIEPKDIGMLPVETWILANNSFLLHGYYNYRHLIFGILQVETGIQYVIGVPGILQNTEQTMAGMFGFHRFLAAQEQGEKQGNFGYWIQQIVL